MTLIETKLAGVYLVNPKVFEDDRGKFIKTFNTSLFSEMGLNTQFKESFYSISKKSVIRGMHFQIPPQDHAKLVYVTRGEVLDVVLDIRLGSPTYGQYISERLSGEKRTMMYIPVGCAHGFLSLADESCMVYLQSTVHSPECDRGIAWNSFGMDWQVSKPVISKRDQEFPKLSDFESPFKFL